MNYKLSVLLLSGFLVTCFFETIAFANKSSVSIEVPESVMKGSEIIIKINVEHNSNSMFHYTKWVYVTIKGKEIARWDYSWRKRPEGKNFSKEITYTVNEPIEIVAEASCNTHGSKGKVVKTVSVKE